MKDRLKDIRKYLKISSQKDFSNQLNWTIGRIQDLESGKVKELKASEAEEIQEKFLINGWWLLTGKGKMIKENEVETNISKSNLINISYFKDTYAAAGNGAINYDEASIVMALDRDFLKSKLGISSFNHLHIINSIGNSMYPTIKTGELLFINPFENENNTIRDKDIYIINTPNGTLVKRIKIHPTKYIYTLVSDNTDDDDIVLEGDEFKSCNIIGRVVGHFSGL